MYLIFMQVALLLLNFKKITGSNVAFEVASACPSEQITLTCLSNESSIHQWTFLGSNRDTALPYVRYVSFDGQNQLPPVHFQAANNTIEYVFSFSRTSEPRTLPLVTELLIDRIELDLNGTEINCTAISNSDTRLLSATVVYVRTCCEYPSPPEVTARANLEMTSNVTVTLKWSQEGSASYNVTIVPQVDLTYIGNTSVQLSVPYNELHCVSVIATLCVHNSAATDIRLNFSNCGHPLYQHNDDTIMAIGYNSPAIPGTNVSFVCIPGLVLTGPSTSMCMETGEWKPDPRKVECKANCGAPSPPQDGLIYPYTDTLKGAKVTYMCLNNNGLSLEDNNSVAVCNQEGYWEPNPRDACSVNSTKFCDNTGIIITLATSSVVLVVSSMISFITGLFCGHLKTKHRIDNHSVPVYEDVKPNTVMCEEQGLEMKSNVAYASVHWQTHM